ncbi:MAG TPA: J domain-containing protein [Myxococcales bacterium]
MIVRLYHADKTVRQDLAEAVASRNGFILATQIQGPRNANLEGRPPFKEILECCGKSLDFIVLIDEGKPEGMWRDPFGELCDRLFREKRESAAATSGWVLIRAGQAMAYFRKALWDPQVDAEEITGFLNRAAPTLFKVFERPKPQPAEPPVPKGPPKPKPKKTPIINPAAPPPPGSNAKAAEKVSGSAPKPYPQPPAPKPPPHPGSTAVTVEFPLPSVVVSPDLGAPPAPPVADRHDTNPGMGDPPGLGDDDDEETTVEAQSPFLREAARPEPELPPPLGPSVPDLDPWIVLGIHRGAQFDEVKKAYRALITQYHPDKVAHLAPEFKKLAEERTREINIAYTVLEKELVG